MTVTTGDARYAGAGVDAQLSAEEFLPLPRLRESVLGQFPDDQGQYPDLSYDRRLTEKSVAAAEEVSGIVAGPVLDRTFTRRWRIRDRSCPLRLAQRWLTGASDLIYTAPGDTNTTSVSGALTVTPVNEFQWDVLPADGEWPETEAGTQVAFTLTAGLHSSWPYAETVREAGILAVIDLLHETEENQEAVRNLLRHLTPEGGYPSTDTEGDLRNPNEGYGSMGFQGYGYALG